MNRKPPSTYFEWVKYLEMLKSEENVEEIISVMECGKFEWTSGVAERFTQKVCDLIEIKLKETTEKLQNDLNNSGSNEINIGQALLIARNKNEKIQKIASLGILPDNIRQMIQDMVSASIFRTQESLMNSAKSDQTGRLLKLIREIGVIPREKIDTVANTDPLNNKLPKRRIIIK